MIVEGIGSDLEGTIVNVEPCHHDGHLALARDLGVILTFDEAVIQLPHFIGGPDIEIVKELKALSGSQLTVEDILARDKAYYFQFLTTAKIEPRNGFLDFHNAVIKHQLPIAIASVTEQSQVETLMTHSGLSRLFDRQHMVLMEDVANLKPAPDAYLKTANFNHIDPKNQLVFEDSPNGVRAAIAAGCTAIGMPVYDKPELASKLLEVGAFRVYKSWSDIDLDELLKALSNK